MPREGWDGGERYDDGRGPRGALRHPVARSNRLFTRGPERDGARVSVTMSMVRDDGHTEAVPVRERRGTGAERGRRGASLPAERSRRAEAVGQGVPQFGCGERGPAIFAQDVRGNSAPDIAFQRPGGKRPPPNARVDMTVDVKPRAFALGGSRAAS
jgi:hypothetical protein